MSSSKYLDLCSRWSPSKSPVDRARVGEFGTEVVRDAGMVGNEDWMDIGAGIGIWLREEADEAVGVTVLDPSNRSHEGEVVTISGEAGFR